MGPLNLDDPPEQALLLVDSAPILYVIAGHPRLGSVFEPLVAAHAAGHIRLAVTTVAIAEVLTGLLGAGDEALADRYRATLSSRYVVDLDADFAGHAARLWAAHRLGLGDAVQAASAVAINVDALVMHDDADSPRDVNQIRDQLVREFGL